MAWEDSHFNKAHWVEFYGNTKEKIPQKAPEARGLPVQNNVFVDVEYDGEHMTRPSHTWIILLQNKAPFIRHSKQHNAVESSTFRS